MQRAMWNANYYKKRTYGLEIMKLFSFGTKLGQQNNFLFSKYFLSVFFCNIFLTKFLLKLPIGPSCSIYEYYKGWLQSLTK